MFASFFYLLRSRGLDVSLNERMTLLEGMEKGLHRSSLTGFYHLCRASQNQRAGRNVGSSRNQCACANHAVVFHHCAV